MGLTNTEDVKIVQYNKITQIVNPGMHATCIPESDLEVLQSHNTREREQQGGGGAKA